MNTVNYVGRTNRSVLTGIRRDVVVSVGDVAAGDESVWWLRETLDYLTIQITTMTYQSIQ